MEPTRKKMNGTTGSFHNMGDDDDTMEMSLGVVVAEDR